MAAATVSWPSSCCGVLAPDGKNNNFGPSLLLSHCTGKRAENVSTDANTKSAPAALYALAMTKRRENRRTLLLQKAEWTITTMSCNSAEPVTVEAGDNAWGRRASNEAR